MNAGSIRTTVVIPNYNGEKYIIACINSLLDQSRAADIIVLDNGSSDRSMELIGSSFFNNSYGNGEVRIKTTDGRTILLKIVELGSNTGFCHAVNAGIEMADTEFVFLLNNDTTADKNAIAALEDSLDSRKNVFSSGALMLSMKDGSIDDCGDLYCALGWAFTPGKGKKASDYQKCVNITAACAGAAMYRRSMLDKTGLFDEAHFCYLEDIDIGYRARILGYKNIYEPNAIVHHIGSASSGSRYNSFKEEQTAANNLYLIYKNMPFLQILLNLPLLIAGILIKAVFFMRKHLTAAYFTGLKQGISKISANKSQKVKFRFGNLKNYLILQIELWLNCIRRLTG